MDRWVRYLLRPGAEAERGSVAKTEQTYEFGGSRVTVKLIKLEQCKADVLVSSDDHMLSMKGGVSQALLRAGGQGIRHDANKQVPATLGDVVVTTAGALPAKHIFHAITRLDGAPPSEDRETNCKVIESATQRSIEKLRSIGLDSIGFPALGAGYTGFQVMDVAEIMANTIVRHLKASPELRLNIFICILPDDIAKDVDFREFFNRFDERTGLVAHVVRDHAVVMIHGIRTEALWFDSVSRLLKLQDHQLHPVAAGYDYLDLFRFLCPWRQFGRAPVERVRDKLDAVCSDPKIRRVSVIAHSFGTYIICEILKSDPNLRLHRLMLCGSVVPSTFDWREHATQIDLLPDPDVTTQRVVNDCGWRDIWPVFAESVTWGYGSAGRFGFQTPQVKDRYHPFGHSDFFKEDFVGQYWVPLLAEGKVTEGPSGQPMSAWWTQLLRVFKLRWGLWPAIAFMLCWLAWLSLRALRAG